MNTTGRSIESVRRFDLFKRLVALGLFVFAIFAYVQNLRAVQGSGAESGFLDPEQAVSEAAVITTPNRQYTVGERIKLSGTGAPNTIVAIFVDGIEEQREAVGLDGTWTMQFSQDLAAGVYQVGVVAIDDEGNTRQQIRSVTRLEIVETDAEPTLMPTLIPPKVTNEISRTIRLGEPLMLSGNGKAGTIVTVLSGGAVELGKAIVDSSGVWSIDLELEQAGEYDLMFVASDADGVQRALGERIALMVIAPAPTQPTIRIDELPAGFTGGDVTIRGEADADIVIGIVYDGKMFDVVGTDAAGAYTYTASFDTPGEHALAAQVIDPNSDVVVISEPLAFTIVAPDVGSELGSPATQFVTPTVTLPALGTEFYGGVVPLAGSATGGSTVVVLINNRTVGVVSAEADATWNYSTTLSVPETYNIYIRVVDSSGRTVASSNVVTLVVQSARDRDEGEDDDVKIDPCATEFDPGEFLPDKKYRVAECETLTSIAQRAGVSIDELVAVNPGIEDASFIKPGQIINLP